MIEPKNITEALLDVDRIVVMQDKLHQFERHKVWHLQTKPTDRTVIQKPDGFSKTNLTIKVPLQGIKQG